MSKKADSITGADSAALPLQPETAPMRVGSADVPPGAPPSPQFTRFGSDGGDGGGGGERRVVANPGLIERLSQFLRDVRSEMRRVSWPSAKDVKNTTIITVVAVIFFAVYLFVVDQGLAFFITQLERLVNWLMGGF